ncbi:NAD(P)/FAD-dependent oxidoreductase [Wenjunlia tyrosinilytica]|uniref:FAD-binding domain-containing protein n=1 Tax=Wenjunlia tyrosinilytica TaxID=1544741 RepID=A0A918DY11_9ACTN|nr:FAD-dependent monooxygenase [Wenjunlia tyrosinilytica]GGO90587.1 hypothetical protein GCM10012280_36450 [Wenjunlia tyrosinilytica]
MRKPTHAVVLGGGLAGTLAASVAASYVDTVTVIERDRFSADAAPRSGVPQARHAHLLWSGGARVIESLLPGTTERWIKAGAHRIGLPDGIVSMSAQGWLRRWPGTQFLITCSRDLLDSVVREQALADARTTLREYTEAQELLGSATTVTGVRIRDRDSGGTEELEADLVVDASGRGSRARQWLEALGLPQAREEVVDSGLAYATRVFRAPAGAAQSFPVVNVQADPREPRPGQTATLLPIEDGRWLVTLSGTRGGPPPTDEEHFVAFARGVRHPVVGELIAEAEPLSPVYASRSTVNRRLFFEKLPNWPRGLVVLGDAVATYNPVYGHGMSVVAHSAQALRQGLAKLGTGPGAARHIQRAVARAVEPAWMVATGQDILYPDAVGPRPNAVAALGQRYVERLMRTAASRPSVAEALLESFTLSGPMTGLLAPKVALATLRGPHLPPLKEPPLTADERSRATSGVPPAGGTGDWEE